MSRRLLLRLVFEGGVDAGVYGEAEQEDDFRRGYRSHVWAELEDGSRHRLTFFDTTRLSQELEHERARGRPFFTEPGLVVVPEITLQNMETAARMLAKEGFFDEPGVFFPERT